MKKTSWSSLKQLIGNAGVAADRFLALVREDGTIACANATMIHELDLNDPGNGGASIFDLIHPLQLDDFKESMNGLKQAGHTVSLELYVHNGIYHPMNWQLNYVDALPGQPAHYLCIGYKIVDDERMIRFNHLLKNNCDQIFEGLTGVVFQDIDGELIAANQKAAAIFGTTLENLYRLRNIEELWRHQWHVTTETGEPVAFEQTPFYRTVHTRQIQTATLIVRLRNGEDRWIHFNCQPLLEEEVDGRFPVITNIIDITYERQLTRTLREREAIIGAFLQETPDLAWVIDEDATLLFASAAFYRHFNISEKDSLHKKVTDLVPPSVNRAVFENHIQVFKTGQPVEAAEKIKWADGSQSISHIRLFPIVNVSGKKLVGGQAIQVHDKSSLEKELKDTRERLLNLSRATSDAIWEWDMQTGQIFRNEALMKMIGYQLDNSKGLSWWLRRIHPEDRNRLADKIKEATENFQQSWQDQYRFKCEDGSYIHVEDKGFVVYENGLPVKMIGSIHNVSSIRELQNELADVRLQRQKEISETIIKVQEKERTRIGHELHDNVNQLLSTAKLFFDGVKPSSVEQKQFKGKSIEYLQMAIEEIRKLSKELVTPQLRAENLAATIEAMLKDIEMAGSLRFRFTHHFDDAVLSASCKITLFRIIQEQIKNIIKHSDASNTSISLKTTADQVTLVIIDDGKGFDPSRTRQGIGLLNISERARFYNGKMELDSAPGKGCTLTVTIPVNAND